MRIVLRSDLANLGKRGDIVNVADGYARNFLIPQGHAIIATAGIQAQADAMRRSRDLKDRKNREGAESVARVLAGGRVTLAGNAAHEGVLYGSVTQHEITEAIEAAYSLTLDRKAVHLDNHIKKLGEHDVLVVLHPDVKVTVTVAVTE